MASIFDNAMTDINNAKELDVIRTTEEIKIRITRTQDGVDKNGNDYTIVYFEAHEIEGSKEFSKFFGGITPDMDAKSRNSRLLTVKKFFEAFPDLDKNNRDSWVGSEGWAILGVEEPKEGQEEYGPKNYVSKFVKRS